MAIIYQICPLHAIKKEKWGHPRYFLFFKDGFGFALPRFFIVSTSVLEMVKTGNIDCVRIFYRDAEDGGMRMT